jgi:hypothetical protein
MVARSIGYRGRENLRKQEEPAPGPGRADECAAHRVSPLFLFRTRFGKERSCVMR